MSIEALPQNVVRNLGSSQALASPIAAVKELVDNAFDARATSIVIEISRNTLDVIQVRDNGCGIPPQDRKLIAMPHCTSKITNESDLQLLGGSSLGFRGEALSSAAQLSRALTMTTRIEGEQIASALTFSRDGQVVGERKVSAPVGTLAKVSDFFHYNPIRRQMAIKNAEGNLKHIKKMLQAYALARPQVRLSLKVLKSQNAHSDWVYAPQPQGNTTALDVVAKVVGAACASQCQEHRIESDGFVLSSILPRPDADATKVGGFGPFLSIDNRPVVPNRGTLRKITQSFHDWIKNVKCTSLHTVRSPFLQLDISCPQGVYDINVEPSKDDVLFADPQAVLTITANLFSSVYATGDSGADAVESGDLNATIDSSPEQGIGIAGKSGEICEKCIIT
jgi:DNA mismatch repair protein MutL